MEKVILVDDTDREVGVMEKMEAHEKGLLHRAFSVFIYNAKGEMLLQQRSAGKYHSPDLWTNACCSHPHPGEETLTAAQRRLYEEMGLRTELQFKTTFIYRSEFSNGLTEYELDHVFTGISEEQPQVNPEEAQAFKWLKPESIKDLIHNEPDQFTTWFRIAMDKIF